MKLRQQTGKKITNEQFYEKNAVLRGNDYFC